MNKAAGLAVCFGLVFSPALAPAPVYANGGDILGGFIAGMVGAAIINDVSRRHHTTYYSTMSSAQRESNREVQTSLNYFGYNAGSPDGVLGGRSREAVMSYQALLGDPVTGDINDYERNILITAHNRAMAGGPDVSQVLLTNPMGARGLLVQQRDAMAGVPAQMAATPPQAAPAPTATTTAAPAAPATGLPSFASTGQDQVSLASACNKVSLQTNSNGGFATVASMTDPEFALSEQFCLARTYVMSAAEDLQAKITGYTPQQIQDQCLSLAPALKDYVAELSLKPESEVLSDVQSFVLNSGMAPAQLASTAKICLGVGYRTDNMDVAVGSALILTALGQNAYAELLGHHLALGFGTSQRRDLALAWYDTSLKAMAAGDMAVAPGMPGRAEVLQKAAYMVTGAPTKPATTPVTTAAALPKFSVSP